MDNIKNELIKSVKEKLFLSYIYKKSLDSGDNLNKFYQELINLNNEELVDIVSEFKELKINNKTYDFFLTRHIFEEILPKINAPVLEIMECVLHLVKEAGRDMTAGWPFTPYIEFCAVESSRSREALKLIETSVHKFVDFLVPTIIAGSRANSAYYLKEAIRLTTHEDIEIRRRAIFSLGRIEYSPDSLLPEQILSVLEKSIKEETNDGIVANIIKSALSMYKYDKSLELRVNKLIDTALTKGNELTVDAASEILWLDHSAISEPLLEMVLFNLLKVKPENKGTLSNIDCGLTKLLERDDPAKGIQFIESLITINMNKISIREFPSTIAFLVKNEHILNRLMTKWFFRGDKVLCEAISEVVQYGHHQSSMLLAVDRNELHSTELIYITLIAQKAIGYLFIYPVTATSIIVSLIPLAKDDETRKILTNLLFDPLLLNYPVKVKKFLETYAENEEDSIKIVCKDAITYFEQYLNAIKSAGNIPELYPSQSQQEAHRRNFSSKVATSQKNAESESAFFSLFSKSILLYGRKSINYVYEDGKQANRMETQLHSHSIEMEFPRIHTIDPFGFDYMLRVFRAGRIEE